MKEIWLEIPVISQKNDTGMHLLIPSKMSHKIVFSDIKSLPLNQSLTPKNYCVLNNPDLGNTKYCMTAESQKGLMMKHKIKILTWVTNQ